MHDFMVLGGKDIWTIDMVKVYCYALYLNYDHLKFIGFINEIGIEMLKQWWKMPVRGDQGLIKELNGETRVMFFYLVSCVSFL